MEFRNCLTIVFVAFLIQAQICNAKSRISLNKNGGFQDLVVAVSPDLEQPKNTGEFLTRIKNLLTNSSKILESAFPVAGHSFYLDSVSILLPPSWKITETDVPGKIEEPTFECGCEADVIVGSITALQDTAFSTLQTETCGEQGRVIRMSSETFKDDEYGGKQFVSEFIKYRYGVFDEQGQRPDVYFNPVWNKFLPNGCTSHYIDGEIKNKTGTCDTSFTLPWLPSTCEFHPNLTTNHNVTSSLLYTNGQLLSSMKQVCDNSSHDKMAVTKQNRLCMERSIMDVVQQHTDFQEPRVIKSTDVTFRWVQRKEGKRRIVFVLDKLDEKDNNNQARVLRTLLRHIKGSLPDDVEIGLVTTDTTTPVAHNLEDISFFKKLNQNDFTDLFKTTVEFKNFNAEAGLSSGLKVIKNGTTGDVSGVVVFIAGLSTVDKEATWNETMTTLVTNKIKVQVVTANNSQHLENLVEQTYGQTYFAVDPVTSLDYSLALEDAIVDICNLDGPRIIPISRTVFTPTKSAMSFQALFKVDEVVVKSLWMLADCDECSIDLISFKRDGITDNSYNSLDAWSATQLKYKNDTTLEEGEYEIYVVVNSFKDFMFSIYGHASSDDVIAMTSWLELPSLQTKSSNDKDMSVLIPRVYAQLYKGQQPITHVDVSAHVHTSNGSEWTVKLKPVQGDPTGLYYGYITSNYTDQFHIIDVTATSTESTGIVEKIEDRTGEEEGGCIEFMNACIRVTTVNTTNLISRSHRTGTFNRIWTHDLKITPNRVTDLHVTSVTSGKLPGNQDVTVVNVTLEWTAPGDRLDEGTAKAYDMRYATDLDSVASNFKNSKDLSEASDVVEGNVSPVVAGGTKTVTLQFNSSLHEAVYMALRAVGTNGEEGERSNIVNVQLLHEIPPTPSPSSKSGGLSPGATAVLVILLVFLVFVGSYFLYRYYRNRRTRGMLTDNDFGGSNYSNL